jgi:aminodeoxychorismate synthase component I
MVPITPNLLVVEGVFFRCCQIEMELTMRLFAKSLESWLHPSDAFVLLFGSHEYAFWLDRETHQSERYSVIGGANSEFKHSGRENLAQAVSQLATENDLQLPFAFRPGLVGALGFESSHDALMLIDRAIVFDHDSRMLWFVGAFENQDDFQHWTSAALLRFALVGGQQAQYRDLYAGGEVWRPELRHDSEAYLALIAKAQEHISVGDVYQLCLTNQIEITTNVDPLMTFLRLREQNPAPYASFFRVAKRSIVSASPEQFLHATAEGSISSKPIKGTRRRGANPEEDAQIAGELADNEKERAENLMIVDLMRNDLGRVCEVGSVEVPKLFEVETYATVHQLVSTVVGRLSPKASVFDAVEAAFPGGSMTGAPKARAIEIIQGLESGERGIYSGALGYISANGAADLGMTIRTLVFEGERVSIGVGGGITIDSEPMAELEETKLKAKALLRALGADDPWSLASAGA